MIDAEKITYSYSEEEHTKEVAIQDVTLHVSDGEFVVVLGHNGSGKSTLAKHLNAILIPQIGTMFVDGMDTKDENLLLAIRKEVGMVFQNPDNQIVANVVEEDVAFAPENLGIPSDEIRRRVDEALEEVGMLEFKKHAPHLLSGGQKQRIAIAGVLAMQPKCIVLDESTAMLDPVGREDVLHTIHQLNKDKGMTVILITHHMEEATLADRVVVMNSGKIVMDGPPTDVFSQVDKIHQHGLECPATVELLFRLNLKGYHCNLGALSIEECTQEIVQNS